MVSDDTEHTILTARALIASAGVPSAFSPALARELRRWLLLLPAGAGKATLSAAFRLLLGVPPERSGVSSAGNGPAMRAAILGVAYGDDLPRLEALVRASSRITHTDPRAEWGALAVAIAASRFARGETDAPGLLAVLNVLFSDAEELSSLLERVVKSIARDETTPEFAESLGLFDRVSGYINHTVPVALHATLRHPEDFRAAILTTVECGGDTDTTAAIAGGIVGAHVGKKGISADWLAGLAEGSHFVDELEALGHSLAQIVTTERRVAPPPLSFFGQAARNTCFAGIVLLHGLRRMLPPYG